MFYVYLCASISMWYLKQLHSSQLCYPTPRSKFCILTAPINTRLSFSHLPLQISQIQFYSVIKHCFKCICVQALVCGIYSNFTVVNFVTPPQVKILHFDSSHQLWTQFFTSTTSNIPNVVL